MTTQTTEIPLRERVGQYGSYVGAIGILLGIAGWLWQGNITTALLILFGIGAAGILTWVILTPEDARAILTGRRARFGTVSVLLTVLLATLVIVVYLLLQRATLTLDFTASEDFTLDNTTINILHNINRPLQITGFYSPAALAEREIDDQLFRQYEVETEGMIRRVYLDPDQEPALAQSFDLQYDGEVFVSFLTAAGEVDFDTIIRVTRETNTERDLTVAIQRLLASGLFKVYIETGYSQLEAMDEGQQGLTAIINGMRSNGIAVFPVDLKLMAEAGGQMPDDASTLVLTRSAEDLDIRALGVLDAYLKPGGSLFILADAVFTPTPLLAENGLFNQYLWENYGIRALDAVVVDALASGETQLDVGSYAVYPDLEIGSRLNQDAETTAQFRLVRALEVSGTPPVTNGQIVASSPQSYGETDLTTLSQTGNFAYDQAADRNGPFVLMAWARDENTGAKIILAGDTDFITNGQIITPPGNSILFTDAIGWLTGYSDQVTFGIQVNTVGLPTIFVSIQQLDLIAFVTVIVMPGVVLLAGFLVWVRRNRRQAAVSA